MEEKKADHPQIEDVMTDTRVPDLDLAAEACITPKPNDPCTFVIFGATGDLNARKLMPALFDLHRKSGLPEQFKIVGCGRTGSFFSFDGMELDPDRGLHERAGNQERPSVRYRRRRCPDSRAR